MELVKKVWDRHTDRQRPTDGRTHEPGLQRGKTLVITITLNYRLKIIVQNKFDETVGVEPPLQLSKDPSY